MERAYSSVHAAARVLNNHQNESAAVVRRRFDGLVGAMVRHRGKAGALADAISHFRKVARSYLYRRAMMNGPTRNRGCFPAHVC